MPNESATNIPNSKQGKLFDYEIVHRPVDINVAESSELADFAMWLHFEERDRTEEKWKQFQKYLGRKDD
jgi:hypothetical protein